AAVSKVFRYSEVFGRGSAFLASANAGDPKYASGLELGLLKYYRDESAIDAFLACVEDENQIEEDSASCSSSASAGHRHSQHEHGEQEGKRGDSKNSAGGSKSRKNGSKKRSAIFTAHRDREPQEDLVVIPKFEKALLKNITSVYRVPHLPDEVVLVPSKQWMWEGKHRMSASSPADVTAASSSAQSASGSASGSSSACRSSEILGAEIRSSEILGAGDSRSASAPSSSKIGQHEEDHGREEVSLLGASSSSYGASSPMEDAASSGVDRDIESSAIEDCSIGTPSDTILGADGSSYPSSSFSSKKRNNAGTSKSASASSASASAEASGVSRSRSAMCESFIAATPLSRTGEEEESSRKMLRGLNGEGGSATDEHSRSGSGSKGASRVLSDASQSEHQGGRQGNRSASSSSRPSSRHGCTKNLRSCSRPSSACPSSKRRRNYENSRSSSASFLSDLVKGVADGLDGEKHSGLSGSTSSNSSSSARTSVSSNRPRRVENVERSSQKIDY
ncbi:unnamed protein product, partial [Amoebophrya sp. A25]